MSAARKINPRFKLPPIALHEGTAKIIERMNDYKNFKINPIQVDADEILEKILQDEYKRFGVDPNVQYARLILNIKKREEENQGSKFSIRKQLFLRKHSLIPSNQPADGKITAAAAAITDIDPIPDIGPMGPPDDEPITNITGFSVANLG